MIHKDCSKIVFSHSIFRIMLITFLTLIFSSCGGSNDTLPLNDDKRGDLRFRGYSNTSKTGGEKSSEPSAKESKDNEKKPRSKRTIIIGADVEVICESWQGWQRSITCVPMVYDDTDPRLFDKVITLIAKSKDDPIDAVVFVVFPEDVLFLQEIQLFYKRFTVDLASKNVFIVACAEPEQFDFPFKPNSIYVKTPDFFGEKDSNVAQDLASKIMALENVLTCTQGDTEEKRDRGIGSHPLLDLTATSEGSDLSTSDDDCA